MLTIGICGASGSGKTTLAKELMARLPGRATLIHQDSYYKDHSHLPLEDRARINYDHPDICLLRRVQRDIIERGREIDGIAKQYLATVKPMYEQYIRNYSEYADVIVAKGGKGQRIVDVLACYLGAGRV